jgi:hyperosmotically inducible periplasmic protein
MFSKSAIYLLLLSGSFAFFLNSVLVSSSEASESRITEEIRANLEKVALGSHEIQIDDDRGLVTLRGFVTSEADVTRVLQAARSVKGVSRVENELEIRPSAVGRRQSPIAARIRRAFADEPPSGDYSVEIDDTGDAIVLRGEARTEEQATRLVRAARGAAEGRPVINEISISQGSTDQDLALRVRNTLEKEAQINLSGIEITASDGIVTFSGTRRESRLIDQILSSALMVEGVKSVRSQMKVSR